MSLVCFGEVKSQARPNQLITFARCLGEARRSRICSGSQQLMSASGQQRHIHGVVAMSAFHPIATKSRTSRHFVLGPTAELESRRSHYPDSWQSF
jgi:hypothetical protein